MSDFIDLRSDTVTKPTDIMREAMKVAIVGDDVMKEDPTIISLQKRIAEMFHKEDALFFPTGTQSNLTAVLCHCERGAEVIFGSNSHMFLYEQVGCAQFGGISPRTVTNLPDGTMDLDEVRNAIRDDDIHEPITRLIAIENTHNACGGRVLPLQFLKDLRTLANKFNLPIHLDGARIWNSITAMKVQPYELTEHVDTISVCLSKGIGAPVGSVLVGSTTFINKARRMRKALGGGMRQAGILAAAGHCALDDFENGMLEHDHRRAKVLVDGMKNLQAFLVDETKVDTNIIFADIKSYDKSWEEGSVSSKVAGLLRERGVRVSAWSSFRIRLVVHRDINDEGISTAIKVLTDVSDILLSYH